MVWKVIMISIAIVIGSFVIAGAIVAAQIISGDSGDFVGREPGNSGQDLAPTIEGDKISIVDNDGSNSYIPNPLEVEVGETVTWVNDDSTVHTATSNDDIFNSDVLFRGDSFSYTFDKEGRYPYFCDVHPNMVGTVVVKR